MNKDYNLRLDLQNRCNTNPIMEFDILDNDTSDFFILITKDGEIVDIEKAIVILAVVKPSGKVNSQFIEVKNNNAYVNLKPSMKDEVGEYTAKAMLILEDDRVVTDAINYVVTEDNVFGLLNDTVKDEEKFTLLTDMLSRLSTIELKEEQRQINEAERILSEENRKIEENKRVETELIRVHEEADRAKYEAIRESNENTRTKNEDVRIENENTRLENEKARILKETKREEAEQLRKDNYNFMTADEERRRLEANEYKEAESLRVEAETNRVNEEAKRRTTEQARALSENQRVSNEETRVSNEEERKNNEIQRIDAENQRKNRYNSFMNDIENSANEFNKYIDNAKLNENNIQRSELERVDSENRRVSNELERISNENTRKANEVAREENEIIRQNEFNNKIAEINEYKINLTNYTNCKINEVETKVNNKINEIDTSKIDLTNAIDNKINEVETKVNSKINEVNQTKSDLTNRVDEEIDKIKNEFDALTTQQQQDAEVKIARDGEKSLNARLNRDLEKGKEVFVNAEGNYISSESTKGYLKNIEILGNTIQDSTNLADIRSVGDKVEGQELYKISLSNCGENILKPNFEMGIWNLSTGLGQVNNNAIRTKDFIRIHNIPHLVKRFDLSLGCQILLYDKDYNFVKAQSYSSGAYVRYDSIDEKVMYAKINFLNTTDLNLKCVFLNPAPSNVGAVEYTPYEEETINILSPTQLEKIGDIEDRIIEKNGVWGVEKNINNIILNGSEVWGTSMQYESTIRFHTVVPDSSFTEYSTIRSINSIVKTSNILKLTDSSDEEGCATGYSDGRIFIKINKNKLSEPTVEGFKKLLNETPLILKYQTNNPTFIPLPNDQQIKLKSFANKTNISFLTEIEGTIKAQTPRSIAASINTHTTQIDDLNKALEKVKKLEESKVSTVETESNFTTVEETTNGYFEDIKLEGKTLVNLANISSRFVENTSKYYIDHTLCETSKLDLNKPYTFIIYCNYLSNHNTNYNYFEFGAGNKMGNFSSTISTNAKYNRIDMPTSGIYTMLLEFTDFKGCEYLACRPCRRSSEPVEGEIANYDISVLLLEGDYTQNPKGYFEGLMSVGQDVEEVSVESVNKNLFNGSVKNQTVNTNGLIASNEKAMSTDFIKVPNDYDITISVKILNQDRCAIIEYDANKQFIKFNNATSLLSNGVYTFKTDKNTKYIIYYYNSSSQIADEDIPNYIMINIGTELNPCILHQSNKKTLLYYNPTTETWEKPILREWDSIEKHSDGKYYYHKRSNEMILNGSENGWNIRTDREMQDTQMFICNVGGDFVTNENDINLISDKFNSTFDTFAKNVEGFYRINGYVYLRILKSKLTTQDVTGFKAWLQANPVKVVYQLSQEKIYECTNIDLITYENETNYIIESGAITPKSTIKVHNNISNIVRLLQSKVSMLENNMTDYMVTQNRLLLTNRYSTDNVGFTVNTETFSIYDSMPQYDTDLYNLILDNILVGKYNYNRNYMESLISFYWMIFIISDEMYFTLSNIIENQHTEQEDIVIEESPNE